MQTQYYTAEQFVQWDYDLRIQKIGTSIRAFRRKSQHWRSAMDGLVQEDVLLEDR